MNQAELKDALNQVCGDSYVVDEVLFYKNETSQVIVVISRFISGFNGNELRCSSFKVIQDAINHFDKTDRIPMSNGKTVEKQKPLELT